MSYKGRRQFPLKRVSFNSKDNPNTFCRFFSKLANSLTKQLPRPKNRLRVKTTEEYYKQIRNECVVFGFCFTQCRSNNS